MRRSDIALLVLVAVAGVNLLACGHKDQPSTPVSPTPTTPASPAPPDPAPPDPAPPPPSPCTFQLSAEPDDFGPEGGNGILRVTTTAGCGWTLKADASWLVIEGPGSGEGPATVKVSAQPNETTLARRMTVTAGDASIVFAQDAQDGQDACTYQVNPVHIAIPRDRWTGEVSITAGRGCRWTASSTASWLRLRATEGAGPATLSYDADFNPQTAYADRRVGTIEIRWPAPTAGQNVSVTQWGNCNTVAAPATGGLPPGASYSGTRTGGTLTMSRQGGTVHFWVLTDPFMGCAWTAESSDTWVTWESPRLHQVNAGDGDLRFTVPGTASSQPRRATITVGGWPLTIVQ